VGNFKLSIVFPLLVFLIAAGCGQGPIQEKLLKSMAKFDQVYVPAFIFTNLQKQRESEIAVERLKKEWKQFNRKYYNLELKYGLNITDKFWKENFEEISGLIISAEAMVKGRELGSAHDKLGGVRQILSELRHRNGLAYFLDGMTAFQEPMEEIIRSLRGKDKLSDKDLAGLRDLFREAQNSWAELEKTEIDPAVFGFDPGKTEAVGNRMRDEEKLLANLAAAFSSKDADRIFQASQDLKPNFIVLYKAFGDFQPIFDQVVKERKESPSTRGSTGSPLARGKEEKKNEAGKK
jgi:hypothetical protein